MKCDIYLQYFNYNDDKFDVSEFYKSSDDYIKALNQYSTTDTAMMQVETKEDEMSFGKCECVLHNENNEDMSVDEIVSYYNHQDLIMMVLDLNLDTAEEEFDSEFNTWEIEHQKIEKLSISDENKFLSEPKRDIYVVFKNKRNDDTYCILTNTKIVDKVGFGKYVVLVDKVIFTKKFL